MHKYMVNVGIKICNFLESKNLIEALVETIFVSNRQNKISSVKIELIQSTFRAVLSTTFIMLQIEHVIAPMCFLFWIWKLFQAVFEPNPA